MTDEELNSLNCWQHAISAIRMLKVIRGEVLPREDEPIDIVLLFQCKMHRLNARTGCAHTPTVASTLLIK